MEKKQSPYVAPHENMAEISWLSVITGILLLVFFGAANAYLGLKVGMTVSASIPAAVMSMAILKGLLKKGTILENNVAQTIASTGEAVAAGVVFSVPALFMLDYTPTLMLISLIALFGGIIGIVGMVIFRRYLIIDQTKELHYPEGVACAEILIAGDKGGVAAHQVFRGGIIGSVFRFVQGGFMLFPEEIETVLPMLPGGVIGMNALPSLAGVGYLIGLRVSAVMLAGGLLAWVVIIPLIYFVGAQLPEAIFPATAPILELGVWGIWENYIQYIGAGVLTIGGIFEFAKALPVIKDSFHGIMKSVQGSKSSGLRTDVDLSGKVLTALFVASVLAIWLIPSFPVNLLGALLVAFFGFLFTSISSRIVGVVGSSSNPVSGMTIATIFFTSILFRAIGFAGKEGMVAAVVIGSIVTVSACTAGDISQDLKTGYLVGASPRNQQIMEILGGAIFAGMSGFVLSLLHNAYTVGSAALPAPATSVIAVLVKGIFSGNLPWALIIIGALIGIICELIGIPSLPFAIGVYLPVHLTVPTYIGGLIRHYVEKKNRDIRHGTLYSSGLVAGDAIIGIVIAMITTAGLHSKIAFGEGLLPGADVIALVLMGFVFYGIWKSTKKSEV
ncbi:MAG: oligopeptide transporter, OPT family [Tissierellia bacterium]|nr:oligopeptide transporter, OPT family [Tissierellia bacterium]